MKWTGRQIASVSCVQALCGLIALSSVPAEGHPHVFVDGGVHFFFKNNRFAALHVTWVYDELETLYILSSHNLSLNAEGRLSDADRRELVRHRSNWPRDFDGSAHLSINEKPVSLKWPKEFDAQVVDDRLRITFTRELEKTVPLTGLKAEVAFYEATYFYAFAVTEQPEFVDSGNRCDTEVLKYDPTSQDLQLQATLSQLSREETSGIVKVGALFADRVLVTCT